MQTFTRSLPDSRIMVPSSENFEPMAPPIPAAFSKIIHASSGVLSTTLRTDSTTWFNLAS